MVTFYVKKYKSMIEKGIMTLEDAIADAKTNVPIHWRDDVINILKQIES